jgi:hypothetical protein
MQNNEAVTSSGARISQSVYRSVKAVTYKGVAEFIYLGTLISNYNSVEKEIQRRILAGNRTYFAAINLFRNRLLSRAIKFYYIRH